MLRCKSRLNSGVRAGPCDAGLTAAGLDGLVSTISKLGRIVSHSVTQWHTVYIEAGQNSVTAILDAKEANRHQGSGSDGGGDKDDDDDEGGDVGGGGDGDGEEKEEMSRNNINIIFMSVLPQFKEEVLTSSKRKL